MSELDVASFIDGQVKAVKVVLGDERALIAVSGGVDSTVSAVITYRALGDNLVCVFIDDNFMRLNEPEKVKAMLSAPPLDLPVKVLNERKRFMDALSGLVDAEEKRKAFRETFYRTLSDAAKAEGCRYLVQGTIRADIEETAGGIKTQHNILEQIGIDPVERFGYTVVEPIASLYKYQVRQVARYLGAPPEASERQPFPGPGLSVRVPGEITEEKLVQLKASTAVVEEELKKLKPAQYFSVIFDGETEEAPPRVRSAVEEALGVELEAVSTYYLKERGTGMVEGSRTYGYVVGIEVERGGRFDYTELERMRKAVQPPEAGISRVLYLVADRRGEGYYVTMRAVETQDFLTAQITEIPWDILEKTAEGILETCPKVVKVFYDVTPKPPATVEFE
ncbi:MAG: GMP synthase [Candidatus Bathyarchaeota archaeon]|nr:MAG: GMP synthase [Candidatus Bathyarchaeota archaeon]